MSRILIIGGHGKVALRLEPLLTKRGDQVTAVIRNEEHAEDVAATGATPLVADVETLSTSRLSELMHGHDAVVWSAGAGGGNPARTRAVDREAAIRSIDAAGMAGAGRFIMVSGFGTFPADKIAQDESVTVYVEAKAAADDHLRRSGLDWTIAAPSSLTLDEPTGRITVGGPADIPVPRGDVAAVIAAILIEPSTIGRTIEFTTGATPIPEAVRG